MKRLVWVVVYLFYFSTLSWAAPNARFNNLIVDGVPTFTENAIDNAAVNIDNTFKVTAPYVNAEAFGAVGNDNGATDSTAAIQAALDFMGSYPFGGNVVVNGGKYTLTSTLTVPAYVSLIGVYGENTDGSLTDAKFGTTFLWGGGNGDVVIDATNYRIGTFSGFCIDANGATGLTGILLESNNLPSSSEIVIEKFSIRNCLVGIQWGDSGLNGGAYAVCGIKIQKFTIWSNEASSRGIVVNSGNSGQQSIISDGGVQVDAVGIDIECANLLQIKRVFGGWWLKTAFIRISIGIDILIEGCSSEGWGSRTYSGVNRISDDSRFLKVIAPGETYPVYQAVITMMHNRINNPITLEEAVRVVSIGDSFGTCYDNGGNVIPVTANGTSGVSSVVAINSGVTAADPYAYGWQDSAYVHLSMFDPGRASWRGVTFSAGDYTPLPVEEGNAWTVDAADVETYQYALHERTMTVSFKLDNTSIAGTPTGLSMAIPAGKTAAVAVVNTIIAIDNGTYGLGYCYTTASGATIVCQKISNGAWDNTANSIFLQGQITFEVN